MKLPTEAIIAEAKIVDYLLAWRPEHDKSGFVAKAGYTADHAHVLARDIRMQLLPNEAVFQSSREYGQLYRVRGTLTSPTGRGLAVVSVRMTESVTGITKFITLFPDKES